MFFVLLPIGQREEAIDNATGPSAASNGKRYEYHEKIWSFLEKKIRDESHFSKPFVNAHHEFWPGQFVCVRGHSESIG